MSRKKEAFVFVNAGRIFVIDTWSRATIARHSSFERATRKARRLGYHVTVYVGFGSRVLAPMNAITKA